MSKKIISLQILFIVLSIGFFAQVKAQSTGETAVGEISAPADEAKFEVNYLDYELKETNLEYLQTLSMPKLKLFFDSKNTDFNEQPVDFKIIAYNEFSEDTKVILNEHWKAALKYYYDESFYKPTDGQSAYKKDIAWANFCIKTGEKIQSQTIEAPNGIRTFSQTESMKLWGFLNTAAVKIIDQVESMR